MSARSDRAVARLVGAGMALAGIGLLVQIGQPAPPAPTASPRILTPQTATSSPTTATPTLRPRPTKTLGPAGGAGRDGSVRHADPLPAAGTKAPAVATGPRPPVTSDPDRIVVPGLAVDAPIVPITASGGVLTPPADPSVIGWWSAGARPGATTGTAVLTGHTVSTGGGAFDDLDQMRAGQRLRIDSGAASTDYVVRSVAVYRKQTLAEHAAAIFDQGVAGRVALVTCEDWDGNAYLSNAVVIAEPAH